MEWLSPLKQIFEFALPFFERLPVIRALLGFILVFFLPGFAWSLVFFKQIRVIERIVFSFALSIVVVTLSILALNVLFGTRITGLNSILIIIVMTIVPVLLYYLRRWTRKAENQENDQGSAEN